MFYLRVRSNTFQDSTVQISGQYVDYKRREWLMKDLNPLQIINIYLIHFYMCITFAFQTTVSASSFLSIEFHHAGNLLTGLTWVYINFVGYQNIVKSVFHLSFICKVSVNYVQTCMRHLPDGCWKFESCIYVFQTYLQQQTLPHIDTKVLPSMYKKKSYFFSTIFLDTSYMANLLMQIWNLRNNHSWARACDQWLTIITSEMTFDLLIEGRTTRSTWTALHICPYPTTQT